MPKYRDSQAFTLIELLSVIGIILVLMGLLVPVIGNAMQKSSLSVAKTTVSKLEMAVRNYEAAFGEYPPALTYEYLGRKLFSENFGAVMPLMEIEDKWTIVPGGNQNDAVYVDPWDQPYVLFWPGMDDYDIGNGLMAYEMYGKLSGAGHIYLSFLEYSDKLDYVVKERGDLGDIHDDRLTHGFVVWSTGPDTVSGSEDDMGNWGHTRSKML
jgi:type II secretory pathway pseudopilin PulG